MLNPSPRETFLEIADRGKTAWWRYFASCILAFLISIVFDVAITLCLRALHWLPPDIASEILEPSRPPLFFAGTGTIFGTLLIGLIIAIALVQRKAIGDVIGRWSWSLCGLAIVIWAAAEAIAGLMDFVLVPAGFRLTAASGTLGLALWALLGLSVQTFCEEFIFRGYLTQAFLLATKNPLAAALVSGLLFGAMHVPNGAPQAVSAGLFGIVTSLIAIRTGGIAFSFGLHLLNNFFGAVVIVSTNDVFHGSPGLISQNTPQLTWWDVAVTAAMLAGTLWLTYRIEYSLQPARKVKRQ